MGTFTKPNDPPLWAMPTEEATDIDYQSEFNRAEGLYIEAQDAIWG